MEKEYTVIVKKGVNLAEVETELTASTGDGPIPSRTVDVANPRPGSTRQTHFMLTDEEATALKADDRILDVVIPAQNRDDIEIGLNATQTFDFTKTTNPDSDRANWGLRRIIETTNVYNDGNPAPDGSYPYALDGTGVDVVIQDTGTSADHPEWEDANGVSRFVELDWYTASGLPGSMPAGHYVDYHGHGTHCAGITAGKTYGFAKGSAIYAVKVAGLEGPSDPNGGISITDCFDVIRLWHAAKTNGRPTVVNMSWGYGRTITTTNPTGGTYQGTPWTYAGESQATLWSTYGIVPQLSDGFTNFRRIPIRLVDVDTEIEDMIDAGIHVTIASGNQYYKIDVPTGPDYDNFVTFNGQDTSYHQGSSPFSDRAYIVGNIDSQTQLDGATARDKTAGSSNKGPGVNIWAPGTDIISAASNTNVFGASSGTYFDPGYSIANISGTSMAAPQVAGVCALHLQANPTATPEQLKNKIESEARAELYSTGLDTDYNAFDESIMGSPNRILYSKYGKQPFSITGSIDLT